MSLTVNKVSRMNTLVNARLGDRHDVCAILKCKTTHLWELTKAGKLTPIRLGRRMTRYDLAEVHRLADSLIANARAEAAAKRAPHSSEPARFAA